MARILAGGEWYEEVSAASLYESELEQLVLEHAPSLYPGYIAVPFKLLVSSEVESHKADLALIDNKYREWWVVEVEMSNHSLNGHVLPQVRTFSQAVYGPREAEYLCVKEPTLDERAVLDMMKGRQPRILVLVNAPKPEWIKTLAPYDAYVGIFEVFRSFRNNHLFRINGEFPKRPVGLVSECTLDPIIPRLLRVASPGALRGLRSDKVRIWYEGQLTEWERIESQTDVYLNPVRSNPLVERRTYKLVQNEDDSLEIQSGKSK